MPGIVGIISEGHTERNKQYINTMLNCMTHEWFYTTGTYTNEKIGLYTGWVCHENSFSDCMPIFNETKDIVLFFSGENFIDRAVVTKLKSKGHDFNSSNASYLIHMYEDHEDGFLQSLTGWFSGIILDIRNSKGMLFNDRYGMQRIYYHETKDALYFASEAKALLKILPSLRKIELENLAHFFTFRCVLQNRTLFPKIYLLPGGSKWTFHNGNVIKKDCYFESSDWENQPELDKETFYQRFKTTFQNILPRYFDGNEQKGISLTGGLDSRLIISCARPSAGTLPCYTFGNTYHDTLDVRIARKLAKVCNQKYYALPLDNEFIANFPIHAERTTYITDGLVDICGSHEIYLNKLAREIAPIRIAGVFGSEVARIDPLLRINSTNDRFFNSDFIECIRKAKDTFIEVKKGHIVTFAAFKEAPWSLAGSILGAQSQLTYRSPFLDNDLVELMYKVSLETFTPDETFLRIIAESNVNIAQIRTKGEFGRNHFPLFSRLSQLFYRSIVFADWYYNWVMPTWLSKIEYTLSPIHAEKLVLGWDQYLFYRLWFRNELSDYVKNILLDKQAKERPYLRKGALEEIVYGHIKKGQNYLNEIRTVLTAELIQRYLIESN